MRSPPPFHEQNLRRGFPAPVPGSTANASAAGAANQAATVVLAGTTAPAGGVGQGVTNPAIVVRKLFWSYSGTPTGGRLTLSDGTGNFLDWDITAAGPGFFDFDPPIAMAG